MGQDKKDRERHYVNLAAFHLHEKKLSSEKWRIVDDSRQERL